MLAAFTDVNNATDGSPPASAAMGIGLEMMTSIVHKLNVGYIWMFANCLTSAAYVRHSALTIYMNAPELSLGASDAQADKSYRLFGLGFNVLQQLAVNPRLGGILFSCGGLGFSEPRQKLVRDF